ncbi:metalloregulator ArsR/SmtB family transcription factor [Mesorhizobium sp. 1M-11]|uniref:helix-turn-helix transcriptional regulator n=1 Tax=Mesorhizobium sp. 1M-11 TaxID=1529006 RepID=UPI000B245E69|nr:metalloregulator ArsR/SmtB family transcription factor [Mesorhizobium sp. 1M-11]
MSSNDLEKRNQLPRPAADRLLTLLKTRGPQTAADLGKALGTTGENARQQLGKLAAEGLAEAHAEARGVGRPVQLWQLTEAGDARFPDTHAELTVQLLRAVRTTFGPAGLDKLIDAREIETLANYRREMDGIDSLRERVAKLAEIRSREGYMAEWREEDDAFMLIENHCPICAAALACQNFCRSELAVFQDVIGPDAVVERLDHILAGARRCAYRVMPKVEHAQEHDPEKWEPVFGKDHAPTKR